MNDDDSVRMALLSPQSRIHLWLLRDSEPIPGWGTISDLLLDMDDGASMQEGEVGMIDWSDSSVPRDRRTQTDKPMVQDVAVQSDPPQLMSERDYVCPQLVDPPSWAASQLRAPYPPEGLEEDWSNMEGGAGMHPYSVGGVYHFPSIDSDYACEEWDTLGPAAMSEARTEHQLIRLSGPSVWDQRAGD